MAGASHTRAAYGYLHALSMLWRLRTARVLLVGNGVLLAVGLGEQAYTFTRPCLMSSRLYSAECGNSAFWLTVVLLCGKVAFFTVLQITQMNKNLQFAISTQVAGLLRVSPPAGPSGWAAASSCDVFQGIVKVSQKDARSCQFAHCSCTKVLRQNSRIQVYLGLRACHRRNYW
jgi:hypothetical protein